MTSSLTQADVERLLAEPSSDFRATVAQKLGEELSRPNLTANEMEIAQEIVRLLATDASVTVRSALSHCIRSSKSLPHDVAMRLAEDVETVSLPILTDSSILTDVDLIAIVRKGGIAKQTAIASRPNISEAVSDEIVDQAGESVVSKLLQNNTANIGATSFGKVLDRFSDNERVKESMALRLALPASIAERLVSLVSDQLRDHLVTHHKLSESTATDLIMQSRDRSVMHLRLQGDDTDAYQFARHLYSHDRLTPSLTLRALCMGDLEFFVAAISVMANVPLKNAWILFDDAGGKGLVALCQKAGLPAQSQAAVRVVLNAIKDLKLNGEERDLERFRAQLLARVLTQFEDFELGDLDYLFAKLSDVLHVTAGPQ
jgi:uncharacterized protein (DUF2336 family)